MAKSYKTVHEQIKILKDRGLLFSENRISETTALQIIEQENYYNIINGYSSVFLETEKNGAKKIPEVYVNKVEFEEVYALYEMDRELRGIISKYLFIFESNIKSIYAYKFSEQYGTNNSYLKIDNYTNDKTKNYSVKKQINLISELIAKKQDAKYNNAIKHYISNHGDVPLWVLVNFLTMGNISYLFDLLKKSDQNNIAIWYSNKFNKTKNQNWKDIRINAEYISSILKIVTLLRNTCAHSERLYCFSQAPKKHGAILSYFSLQTKKEFSSIPKDKLLMQLIILRAFLEKDQANRLYIDTIRTINEYSSQIATDRMQLILNKMGFCDDWENLLMSLI